MAHVLLIIEHFKFEICTMGGWFSFFFYIFLLKQCDVKLYKATGIMVVIQL